MMPVGILKTNKVDNYHGISMFPRMMQSGTTIQLGTHQLLIEPRTLPNIRNGITF